MSGGLLFQTEKRPAGTPALPAGGDGLRS